MADITKALPMMEMGINGALRTLFIMAIELGKLLAELFLVDVLLFIVLSFSKTKILKWLWNSKKLLFLRNLTPLFINEESSVYYSS